MRLLRGTIGAVLWIVAALIGLVGLVLCVTVILLPVGIPLLGIAGKLLTRAVRLMLPRAMAHPVNEVTKSMKKEGLKARDLTADTVGDVSKKASQFARKHKFVA